MKKIIGPFAVMWCLLTFLWKARSEEPGRVSEVAEAAESEQDETALSGGGTKHAPNHASVFISTAQTICYSSHCFPPTVLERVGLASLETAAATYIHPHQIYEKTARP